MGKPLHDLEAPQKDARSFDAFFFSLSKADQQKYRDAGVLPYREAVQPRRVCEVQPWRRIWNSTDQEQRVETDSYISREHVGQMLKAFIDALAMTDEYSVRRHVELVRWALDLPGCLPAPDIAKMYDVSKQAIHKRAKLLRVQFTPDALGEWTGQHAEQPTLNSAKNTEKRKKNKGKR
jgi:hypothetical protein